MHLLAFFAWCAVQASITGASPVLAPLDTLQTARCADGQMKWTGPVFAGGENVTLCGMPSEIVTQLKTRNPNYVFLNETSDAPIGPRDTTGNLTTRGFDVTWDESTLLCKPLEGDTVYVPKLEGQIKYLNSLPGDCVVEAGTMSILPIVYSRTCARISCDKGAGIFFCNWTQKRLARPCRLLSLFAQKIMSDCPKNQFELAGVWRGGFYLDFPKESIAGSLSAEAKDGHWAVDIHSC